MIKDADKRKKMLIGNISYQHFVYIVVLSMVGNYLLTWNFVIPSLMKPTIWFAAARPALVFASAV